MFAFSVWWTTPISTVPNAGAAGAHVDPDAQPAGVADAEQDEAARGAQHAGAPVRAERARVHDDAVAARRRERPERVAAGAHERARARQRAEGERPAARQPVIVKVVEPHQESAVRWAVSAFAMVAGTRRGSGGCAAAPGARLQPRRTGSQAIAARGSASPAHTSASHCSPKTRMSSTIGSSARPLSVSAYSTRGGTSAYV